MLGFLLSCVDTSPALALPPFLLLLLPSLLFHCSLYLSLSAPLHPNIVLVSWPRVAAWGVSGKGRRGAPLSEPLAPGQLWVGDRIIRKDCHSVGGERTGGIEYLPTLESLGLSACPVWSTCPSVRLSVSPWPPLGQGTYQLLRGPTGRDRSPIHLVSPGLSSWQCSVDTLSQIAGVYRWLSISRLASNAGPHKTLKPVFETNLGLGTFFSVFSFPFVRGSVWHWYWISVCVCAPEGR